MNNSPSVGMVDFVFSSLIYFIPVTGGKPPTNDIDQVRSESDFASIENMEPTVGPSMVR
jgi:hypothetical protein